MVDVKGATPEEALAARGGGATPSSVVGQTHALIQAYNQLRSPYPENRTLVDLFEAQCARTPLEPAIQWGDRYWTYAELDSGANRVAGHLALLGVGPSGLCAVCMGHSFEAVCALLGVLKAGAAYVPIDPATPEARLSQILDGIAQGRPPVILTQPSLRERLRSSRAEVVEIDDGARNLAPTPVNQVLVSGPGSLAYVIYTSGSTGTPKGVMVEHRSLVNYIWWAKETYCRGERLAWPLFTSLGFDLTVTSLFVPLVTGGRVVLYPQEEEMPGMGIVSVIEEGLVDIVKLTPAHLALIQDLDLRRTRIRALVVGGEDLRTELARTTLAKFGRSLDIYNEYGPTEATVGCMIHRYDPEEDVGLSVPIGVPAANSRIHLLDDARQPVSPGFTGEIYIGGDGLARGYFGRADLTERAFLRLETNSGNPTNERVYRTGDLARWNAGGRMEFLGRVDHQVKIGSARVELGEIEAALLRHKDVRECVVDAPSSNGHPGSLTRCARCGLASNVPDTTYDAAGVCNVCRAYDTYAEKANAYFKTREDLEALVTTIQNERRGPHDAVVLLSGGKDSTYMLYQLCALGLKPLAFTLDNGFISEEAKTNIRRVVDALGVELVFGTTPHMKEIFVDSLKRFANVCNGCFKTIYTLATHLAHERGIGYIFTGLSRGQFFETRLTEDLFRSDDFDPAKLDEMVLEARKAYHRRSDAVSRNLEVDLFRGDSIFEDIRFVDFYRYWSAPLSEMRDFLRQNTPWVRPSDTGRSTNCRINDIGIHVHQTQRGFHNYAIPYSWDVRLGQKTRSEAVAELEDEIDEGRIRDVLDQIGYEAPRGGGGARLVAYYVSGEPLTASELRFHLAPHLPEYMVPSAFVRVPRLPLTPHGKVDRAALRATREDTAPTPPPDSASPRTETEARLAGIWCQLLNVARVGLHDDFFDLGGQSLTAIQAVSRIRDAFAVDVPLRNLFEHPTLASLAQVIDGLSWADRRTTVKGGNGEREEIEI